MSPPSGEHWATMVCMAELQEASHYSPKRKALTIDHVDRGLLVRGLLEKCMDGWNQNRTYWFKWEAIMLGEKNTLHSSLRIVSRLWNMVVVVSWLGPVLLNLGQDSLPSLMEQWILNYTSKFWRKTSEYLFKNRVSRERGSCSKTTTPSTQVILPKNSLRTKFLSPDLSPIKMLWKDLSKQFIDGNPPTSQSLIGSALRNGLKLHVIVQDWSAFTRNFTFSYCS